MTKHSETTEQSNSTKPVLTNFCSFVPYGEVENRCTKCGYITWVDESKTFDEIIEDMHKSGYPKPDCYNNLLTQKYTKVLSK